jgi:hypothetical protein
MDDIWASYYLEWKHPEGVVIYNKPTVYQERNVHSLSKDIENELIGYKHSLEVAKDPSKIKGFIPDKSWAAFEEYQRIIKEIDNEVNNGR